MLCHFLAFAEDDTKLHFDILLKRLGSQNFKMWKDSDGNIILKSLRGGLEGGVYDGFFYRPAETDECHIPARSWRFGEQSAC